MPNFNSILGGLANVASQIKGAQGQNNQGGNNQGGSGYPNQSGGSAYPNQGGSAYPNQGGGGSGYPNQGAGSGYPNQGGGSGYPNQGGYGGGSQPSAYQGYGGGSQGGQDQSYGGGGYQPAGYPSGGPSSGYPPSGGPGYPSSGGGPGYPPSGNSPYPSSGAAVPYPSGDVGGFPQGPGSYNNAPYPQGGNAGGSYGNSPYPPQMGGGSYGGAPPPQQNSYGQQNVYPNIGQGAQPPHHHQPHQPQQPSAPPQYQTSYAPSMNNNPSIRPIPSFNANTDAETLRKAMKGFGCNNDKVVAVLCQRSNWQRQEIAKTFKTMYGKDLINDLKSELHGDFEDLILALLEPPARFDAYALHKAMAGLGTKEHVLIEVMTTRTNAQIHELKATYQQMYHRSLEQDLIGETSGHFKRLLVSLCAGGRDESNHVDPLKANHDARNLYRAGEQRLGTDESCFNAILASQNFAQLRLVFEEYQKITKHSIEKAVESEFSGDIRDGLMAVVKCIRSRPSYLAELLQNSMKGMGTRDTDLIRLVVTRAEIDLRDIREAYQRMYKTSLENTIKGDCSGAYKDGLIALVKGNY